MRGVPHERGIDRGCAHPAARSRRLGTAERPDRTGETPELAARREAREETGLIGDIKTKIDTIKYSYTAKWEDPPTRIFKIVTFFLLQFTGGNPEDHDREVERVEWFPIDDAIRHASYKQEKDVLKKARELISSGE